MPSWKYDQIVTAKARICILYTIPVHHRFPVNSCSISSHGARSGIASNEPAIWKNPNCSSTGLACTAASARRNRETWYLFFWSFSQAVISWRSGRVWLERGIPLIGYVEDGIFQAVDWSRRPMLNRDEKKEKTALTFNRPPCITMVWSLNPRSGPMTVIHVARSWCRSPVTPALQASARSTFFVAISGPRLSIRHSNERVADYAHEESLRLRWSDRARSASAVSNRVMATWRGDHCSAADWSATAVKGQAVIQFKLPNTAAAKGAEHDLSFLPGGNQCSATKMSATLRKGKLDADFVPTIGDGGCGTAGMSVFPFSSLPWLAFWSAARALSDRIYPRISTFLRTLRVLAYLTHQRRSATKGNIVVSVSSICRDWLRHQHLQGLIKTSALIQHPTSIMPRSFFW